MQCPQRIYPTKEIGDNISQDIESKCRASLDQGHNMRVYDTSHLSVLTANHDSQSMMNIHKCMIPHQRDTHLATYSINA